MAAKRFAGATATAAIIFLGALLVLYGVSLITPGTEYAGSTTTISFDASGATSAPVTTTYTTYVPTLWGFLPIAFAVVISFATLFRLWPIAIVALAVMTAFGFISGFSIGGPIFAVGVLMFLLLPIAYATRSPDRDLSASMRARWDRLTKLG